MNIYVWSIIITLILYIVLQYIEKQKYESNNQKYNLFTIQNLLILVILYIIITIIIYYITISSSNTIISIPTINNDVLKDNIDPNILKKINDNISIGFEPNDEFDI